MESEALHQQSSKRTIASKANVNFTQTFQTTIVAIFQKGLDGWAVPHQKRLIGFQKIFLSWVSMEP